MKIQIGAILFNLMKRITELYSEFGKYEVMIRFEDGVEAYPDLESTFKELNRTIMAFEDTLDICLTPKERAKLTEWKYWDEIHDKVGKKEKREEKEENEDDEGIPLTLGLCCRKAKNYSNFIRLQLRPKYKYLLQLCKKHGLSPLEKGGKFGHKA
jgi:hypothetical protein